jgi:hypothetical protein
MLRFHSQLALADVPLLSGKTHRRQQHARTSARSRPPNNLSSLRRDDAGSLFHTLSFTREGTDQKVAPLRLCRAGRNVHPLALAADHGRFSDLARYMPGIRYAFKSGRASCVTVDQIQRRPPHLEISQSHLPAGTMTLGAIVARTALL